MRTNEEPSPSFLRIMVTDQILEEDSDSNQMDNTPLNNKYL